MKRYSSYKQHTTGWIESLPEHWAAVPVKYVCTYNDDVLPESIASDTLIEYVEISDVDEVNGLKGSESMAFQEAPSRARRLVRDGDIIISTVRTYLRAVAPIKSPPDNLVVSTGFAVIRPDGLAPCFARYALVADGFVGSVIARSTGVSYPAINASDLVRISVPVPPIDEQLAIADYLDTESKRIDGLIEEKLKLKELLIELRVATISDAVAKGLDSNVRKKNAGVAWLGEIPQHWKIKRVKHIARFTTGWTPPTGNAAFYIGANPWANIGDLGPKVITETANQISDEAVKNTGINISPIGSLLFSFKLSVGQVSIAGQSMFTNEAIATFPPQDDFDIQWAFYAFPKFIPENAAINIYGAKLLNQQRINDALLPFPPKNEQIAIANYLDSETKRMDGLIEHVDSEIELLKELRASTITDAVLGRIDVRQAATH